MKTAQPKSPKIRKSRAGLSLKRINLDKIHRQLLNVVLRETAQLLEVSHKRLLNTGESAVLLRYIKLVRELRKDELEGLDGLSDKELEEIANGKK